MSATGQLIQKVLAKKIEEKKRKTLVIANLANQSFSGDIREGGETVKIVEEANVTKISSTGLSGLISTYEDLAPSAQEMRIDQTPAFNIRLSDIEKDQIGTAKGKELISKAIDRGMYILKDDVDSNLAGLYSDAGLVYTSSTVTITKSNAYEYLNRMATVFSRANLGAKENDWCAILPPEYIGMLELDTANQYTPEGYEKRMTGWKGRCSRWQVFESNNIAADGSSIFHPLFIIKGESLALAMQKEPTYKDTTRPNYWEESHAYRIVYGRKGYRPDKIGTFPCNFSYN